MGEDASAAIIGSTVTFLLENVKQYVVKQVGLIKGARSLVQNLENDLIFIHDFLMETAKQPEKDILMRDLLRNIRNTIYDAEDAIDTFITLDAERKAKWSPVRCTKKLSFATVSKQIQHICQKIVTLRDEIKEQAKNLYTRRELGAVEQNQPPKEKVDTVGFGRERNQLIQYLTEATENLDVVSVIGMPGIGKTTLACKIFNHPEIEAQFPTIRIWVKVSNATTKNVFLCILKELMGSLTNDLLEKSCENLGLLVASKLDSAKGFLIVLDDVRTTEDWKKLQTAFPRNSNKGKVLITSQNNEVGHAVNQGERLIKMNQLTLDESWELLKMEAFGKKKCPKELEHPGKMIAFQCDGLPQSIVIIGDVLNKMALESDQTSVWEKVSKSVTACVGERSIMSSYDQLPYHLRDCFLYLGMFPEDHEIPASNLIRMWIAEGLVQQKDGWSLEENAEVYLTELINRSLVKVEKKKPNGRTKTCSISYLVRYFCKKLGGYERENFLQEINKSSTEDFQPPISDVGSFRRLCIHSHVSNFISRGPPPGRLRSFVSFSRADFRAKKKHITTFLASFKLLRVLDAQPIVFKEIPKDLYLLVHLRYITLSLAAGVLPAGFTKLRNLQSLTVHTSLRTLEIEADILKMSKLRHMKTNVAASLPKATKSTERGAVLQRLNTITPKSVTNEFCERAVCLKKLSIEGQVTTLPEGAQGLFNALARLRDLEKLKLLNDVTRPSPASEAKPSGLPQRYQFPSNLRSLILSATSLDWDFMSVLRSLEKLEILKMKENAFVGDTWEASSAGFPRLEVLHIDGFTEFKTWTATKRSFPRLRRLNLWNCQALKDVPIQLAAIPTFKLLDLRDCTLNAENSAHRIEDKKQSEKQTHNTAMSFKLNISRKDG